MAHFGTRGSIVSLPFKLSSRMVRAEPSIQFPSSSVNINIEEQPAVIPNWKLQPNNDFDTLCKEGRLKEALHVLRVMERQRISVDFNSYASLLQVCADTKSLIEGKQVHAHMANRGLDRNVSLGTKLVNMYAMCGSLDNAGLVFDKIPNRNAVLWNAMIRGHAKNGNWEDVLTLYYEMLESGIQPDNFTFPLILKACAGLSALQEGMEIHYHIDGSGFESDIFVATALIDMYAKCGNTDVARQVFDKMSGRDVISWNAMIAGYAHNGRVDEGLSLFHQMQLADLKPNSVTVVIPRMDMPMRR